MQMSEITMLYLGKEEQSMKSELFQMTTMQQQMRI